VSDQGPGPDIEPSTPLDLTWGLLAHPERNATRWENDSASPTPTTWS
jgi:hypothetical protein